jgi:hypothetical protein
VTFLFVAATVARLAGAQELPALHGPHGVGRVEYDWTDQRRQRELLVHAWYPASNPLAQGPYLPGAQTIDSAPGTERVKSTFRGIWPLIVSGAITSHAQNRTPPARSPKQFPIVLFSHGAGTPSASYTAKIEDLVSRGFVVVAAEHPGEAPAAVFPDGRVVPYATDVPQRCQPPPGASYDEVVRIGMGCLRERAEVVAEDLRFILTQVAALNQTRAAEPNFFGRLDLARVAAVGHSLGGFASVRACQKDERIAICVNEDGGTADGAFLQYAGFTSPKQPLLYVEASVPAMTDEQLAASGLTREEWTQRLDHVLNDVHEQQLRQSGRGSFKVTLKAPGMQHGSFGDAFLTAGNPEASRIALHNLALTEEVTRAFLDKHLKALKQTLLDEGVERPEIVVKKYDR